MFYQRVTAAISVVDAIFLRHDCEHARRLRFRAHLSIQTIQFVLKSARSLAHHYPCRLRSRLSLISRESAARLVCGPFDPPAFCDGDLVSFHMRQVESTKMKLGSLQRKKNRALYCRYCVLLKAFQILFKKLRFMMMNKFHISYESSLDTKYFCKQFLFVRNLRFTYYSNIILLDHLLTSLIILLNQILA